VWITLSRCSVLSPARAGARPASRRANGCRPRSARAPLHAPKNLLLDEPTNGLDIPTVRSLRAILRRLRDSGVCVVFSSHVLEEVRALCNRLVVISGGSLVAEGSPAEICTRAGASSLEDAFVKLTGDMENALC
jgi:sodium transport system ATP-binding protein